MSQWFLLMVIPMIFIGIGAALPYIHDEYEGGSDITGTQVTSLDSDLTTQAGKIEEAGVFTQTVTFWDVFKSIFSMFFWTFGELPIVVDLFFLVLRIVWVMLIFDLVWI